MLNNLCTVYKLATSAIEKKSLNLYMNFDNHNIINQKILKKNMG